MDIIKVKKLRRYNTDIHILSFTPSQNLMLTLSGEGKREKLSKNNHDWLENHDYKNIAKTNISFFDFRAKVPLGFYFTDGGFLINSPNFNAKYKATTMWGAGVSYSLVKNGKKHITNTEPFDHYKYNHPRKY